MENFEKELKTLINKYSKENESNTPDWLLAQYLIACLAAFTMATQQRETWYGRDARPTANSVQIDVYPDIIWYTAIGDTIPESFTYIDQGANPR